MPLKKQHKMEWRAHTRLTFEEILSSPHMYIMRIPLTTIHGILQQVAQRAVELDDPVLNKLMVRLTMYAVADPHDLDYDEDVVNRILAGETLHSISKSRRRKKRARPGSG